MKPKDFFSVIIFIIQFIMGISGLYAQEWTEPAAISDSVSDNRNPLLKEVIYNGFFSYMLFWERSADTTSTDIYCRNFYNMDEPFPVVGSENIHCSNPRIISTIYFDNDTLFYLFYETDQNGNSDIYYKIYTYNGFTEPVLFAGSESDETHFRCNDGGAMIWQEGDKIKSARLYKFNSPFIITDPVTVDSVNCSSPDVSIGYSYWDTYFTWLKQENDSTYIYLDNWNGSQSERLAGSDEITSLRFASGTCMDEAPVISWENIENDIHTIHAKALFSYDEYISDFQQESAFSPAMTVYYTPVEDFYVSGFLTFIYAVEQNNDVYVNTDDFYISPEIEYYLNISDSPYLEANPAIFQGEFASFPYRDMFLIWESKRNDYWQLFYSFGSMLCAGSVEEQQISPVIDLKIFPNPVSNACDISYVLKEKYPVSILLFSPDGKQVILMNEMVQDKGEQICHLYFDQLFPVNTYSGLYMVKVQVGNGIATQKIIRIR